MVMINLFVKNVKYIDKIEKVSVERKETKTYDLATTPSVSFSPKKEKHVRKDVERQR